ncbi:cytochrome P450-like protein [Tanacetum coccineum]
MESNSYGSWLAVVSGKKDEFAISGLVVMLYLESKLHVMVNSVELAKVVTGEQDKSFANRDPHKAGLSANYDANDIAWSKNSANWRKLRNVLVHEVLSIRIGKNHIRAN